MNSKFNALSYLAAVVFAGAFSITARAGDDVRRGPYVSPIQGFPAQPVANSWNCDCNIGDPLGGSGLIINGNFNHKELNLSPSSVTGPGRLIDGPLFGYYKQKAEHVGTDFNFYGLASMQERPADFPTFGFGAGVSFDIKKNWIVNLEFSKSAIGNDAWFWLSYSP